MGSPALVPVWTHSVSWKISLLCYSLLVERRDLLEVLLGFVGVNSNTWTKLHPVLGLHAALELVSLWREGFTPRKKKLCLVDQAFM